VSIGKKILDACDRKSRYFLFSPGRETPETVVIQRRRSAEADIAVVQNFPEPRRCAHPDTGHVSADPDRRWVVLLHIAVVYLLYINKIYSNTVCTSSRIYIIYIMYTYVYIYIGGPSSS